MKTIILTSILAICLSVSSVFAQESKCQVLTNIEKTASGSTKEMIYLNKESAEPEKKAVLEYDSNDLLLSKTEYKMERSSWQPVQKYEYKYDAEGKPAGVTLTKWDSNKKKWADKEAKHTAHTYNGKNELMAVQ